jgi:hypothetical protein
MLVDHRLAGGDKFVHLVTRQREPSADRNKPRPHFGLVDIGQVDAQHAPGDIIAWVPIIVLPLRQRSWRKLLMTFSTVCSTAITVSRL